jgi:hypothetical protein
MSSAEKTHELIESIIKALEVESKRRNECIRTIHLRLESAKSLRLVYKNPPGAQRLAAAALSRALKKAQKLLPQVEPLFSSIMYDAGGLSFRDPLNRAIAAADRLAATIVASDGKKSRNFDKWQAKLIAADLVAEFSPLAGKRAAPRSMSTTATAGKPGKHGESGAAYDAAVLIYQILTGREEEVDLTDSIDDYAPPAIKTQTAVSPRSASQQASDLALALAELEEMRKLTTEEHVPHSPRCQITDAANAWFEQEKMRPLAEALDALDATRAHRCKNKRR